MEKVSLRTRYLCLEASECGDGNPSAAWCGEGSLAWNHHKITRAAAGSRSSSELFSSDDWGTVLPNLGVPRQRPICEEAAETGMRGGGKDLSATRDARDDRHSAGVSSKIGSCMRGSPWKRMAEPGYIAGWVDTARNRSHPRSLALPPVMRR